MTVDANLVQASEAVRPSELLPCPSKLLRPLSVSVREPYRGLGRLDTEALLRQGSRAGTCDVSNG